MKEAPVTDDVLSCVAQVSSRILQTQSSQDGEDLGREGDEEPHSVSHHVSPCVTRCSCNLLMLD